MTLDKKSLCVHAIWDFTLLEPISNVMKIVVIAFGCMYARAHFWVLTKSYIGGSIATAAKSVNCTPLTSHRAYALSHGGSLSHFNKALI